MSTNIPAGFWLAPMEPDEEMHLSLNTGPGRWIYTNVEMYQRMRDSWISRHSTPPVDAVPGEPVASNQYFWLVELFHRGDTGNSLGRYHTGLTDLNDRSRSTENVYEGKRYASKEQAEKAASSLDRGMLSLEWRAVEHGFMAAPVASHAGSDPVALAALLQAQVDVLTAELHEEARINGMGGEREAALLARVEVLTKERDVARQPVGHEARRRGYQEGHRDGMEQAAGVCDNVNNFDNPMTSGDCADLIRALAAKPAQEKT